MLHKEWKLILQIENTLSRCSCFQPLFMLQLWMSSISSCTRQELNFPLINLCVCQTITCSQIDRGVWFTLWTLTNPLAAYAASVPHVWPCSQVPGPQQPCQVISVRKALAGAAFSHTNEMGPLSLLWPSSVCLPTRSAHFKYNLSTFSMWPAPRLSPRQTDLLLTRSSSAC